MAAMLARFPDTETGCRRTGDDDDQSGRATAYAAFRTEHPPAIAAAVQDFRSNQWPMLEMLDRQPLALDIAESSPVLAFMLANNNGFRNTTIGPTGIQAAGYALRKQRCIQARRHTSIGVRVIYGKLGCGGRGSGGIFCARKVLSN